MQTVRAFSLVEVTLAIGVIGFALIAVFGLVPVGLKSGRDSVDATRISMVGADLESRIRASVTRSDFPATASPAARTITLFYDKDGLWFDHVNLGYGRGFYRVDATIGASWASPIPNVDEHYLRPVSISVAWPVDLVSGNPIGNNKQSFAFYVRTP
jgi:uncharacterized protein (TIGR02598 family)